MPVAMCLSAEAAAQTPDEIDESEGDQKKGRLALQLRAETLEDFEACERDEDREQRGDRDVPEATKHRRACGATRRPPARARQRGERHPVIGCKRVQCANGRCCEHQRSTSSDHDDAAPVITWPRS